MQTLLLMLGRVAGATGFVMIVVAFLMRLAGQWYVAGLPIGTLLQGGVALATLGCLGYLASIAERKA